MLAHFHPTATANKAGADHAFLNAAPVPGEIERFLQKDQDGDLATDQLLNALHLLTLEQNREHPWPAPDANASRQLRSILYRGLHARDRDDDDGADAEDGAD